MDLSPSFPVAGDNRAIKGRLLEHLDLVAELTRIGEPTPHWMSSSTVSAGRQSDDQQQNL